MRSIVPVQKDGEPAGPVLTLYDRRGVAAYRDFLQEFGIEKIYAITGQRFDVASTPAKLRWLSHHESQRLHSAWKVLAPKDYVRLWLTGQAATDPIDASGWLLYDLERRGWHPGLVAFSGINPEQLPEIRPACSIAGTLRPEIADQWSVGRDVHVVIGGGDDIAATGCGVTRAGDVYEHLGSTGSIFVLTDRRVLDPQRVVECYPTEVEGSFWVGGSCNSAGTSIDHALRLSAFCASGVIDWTSVSAAMERWNSGLPAHRPMFLPYVTGERCPIWNAAIRGGWANVCVGQSAEDWALAVHEGVACVLAWILEELTRLVPATGTVYAAGRAAENRPFAHLRATIYNREIRRIEQPDAALIGASMIAAIACGEAKHAGEIADRWRKQTWTASPDHALVGAYAERLRIFQRRTRELIADASHDGASTG